jgi:hypothetical protein
MLVGGYQFIWVPPAGGLVSWERRWETDTTRALQGQEEREAKRSVGLKTIQYDAQPITVEETADLLASIAAGLKSGKACAPFWGRSSVLAADCAAASNTVTLEDNVWGFAIGDKLFLIDQEARLWEVRSITNVVGNVLTLDVGVARTYRAATLVWPLIYGRLACETAKVETNHRALPRLKIVEEENGVSKSESNCPIPVSYLGRPVAPLDISDSTRLDAEQSRGFQFDLRDIRLGFGAPTFSPLQSYLVNGWEVMAILDGAAAIQAWDCFTAALLGRANGFWLADVSCLFDITSSPAGNTVRATDSGLAEVWAADPAIYVVFRKQGSADKFAGISSVTDIGGGLEEIVLDAAVAVDATWLCYRLRYVRMVDDVEKANFPGVENRQYRTVRVVELPHEYAAEETGTQPVWLYTFWIETPGGSTYWRYTSFGAGLNSGGNAFAAANITHGALKRSTRPESDEATIEVVRENGTPFAFFAPLTLPLNLWVKIEEATVGDPDTTTALFTGIVQRGPMVGKQMTLRCASAIDALGAESPNFMFQQRCNYRVFGPGCNNAGVLQDGFFSAVVTIDSISADRRVIELRGAPLDGTNINGYAKWADQYWALGWIAYGAGANYQVATILKSLAVVVAATNGARIFLSVPLIAVAAVNDTLLITPGCDGLRATCIVKYNNYVNFGGQPFLPKDNPSVPDVNMSLQGDAKK